VENYRTYGTAPYTVAVVHGGPGAAGQMAPVARELAGDWGVLEPLQTATTLAGQVDELRATLESYASPPVALVGFSWGAWLSYMLAARHPTLVRKLLLVSSGPFEEQYVARLEETRMNRLSVGEQAEWQGIETALRDPLTSDKDRLLARLGTLASKADAYDPIAAAADDPDALGTQGELFHSVWAAAVELRRNGELLELGRQIQCPLVAIHGDYDPHPAEGVQKPLSALLKHFRLVLLRNCGHSPWLERQARASFYAALRAELACI
jgi:pimeloyl-ACP methyl ester carboxylesterase